MDRYAPKVLWEFWIILQLIWLTIVSGTKERTEKISMSSIKTVVNEPIEGHEEYHIIVRYLEHLFFKDIFVLVFYLVLSVELGDSAGSNWSFKVLDLLDTMSICWCNKRNNFRKMALFLIKMKDMFSFLKLSFLSILFIISSGNINWRVNHFFLVLTCCLFKNVSVNFIVAFCIVTSFPSMHELLKACTLT